MNKIKKFLALVVVMMATVAHGAVDVPDDEYVIFYAHDLLGSPVAVSDDKGRLLWHEYSQPFGKSLNRYSASGEGFPDNAMEEADIRLGYTGHEKDFTSGLVYMKARYYDPDIGRFYSNDPIGFFAQNTKSFSRYQYALNNPYLYRDPTGLYGSDYTAENTADEDEAPTNESFYVQTERDRAIESGEESAYDHYNNPFGDSDNDNDNDSNPTIIDAIVNWKNDALEMFFDASLLTVQPINSYTCTDSGLACRDAVVVSGNSDWLVHGTVTLELMPNGEWGISSERYNFEQHEHGTGIRNSLTEMGAAVHGEGTAFGTHFFGSPSIYEGFP